MATADNADDDLYRVHPMNFINNDDLEIVGSISPIDALRAAPLHPRRERQMSISHGLLQEEDTLAEDTFTHEESLDADPD